MPVASFVDSFLTPWDSMPQEERGKELPTDVKSEEEIAKYSVDEHLSEVERTVGYLQGGLLIQQKQAIASLPLIIMAKGRQGWDALAQPLKSALSKMDADAQVAAAEAFTIIALERYMTAADVQACLLPIILRNINKEKSEEETEAWLCALLEIIPLVDKEYVESEIMSLALSKGEMDEVTSKVICIRLLGAICPRLTKDEAEKSFFKKLLAMCQDVEYGVRIAMCSQLATLGRTMGKDATQKLILDEIVEALKDEEVQVRDVAFSSLVALLDLFSPEVRKSRVLPLLRDHMRPFELDIVMQRSTAKNFGRLITLVKSDLDKDDLQVFYGCFKHLCAKSDIPLRSACASQFAVTLKAAVSATPQAYSTQFHDTFFCLASDAVEDIRLSVAMQLHEVAALVGGKEACWRLLVKPLTRLLRDESQAVQSTVLQHLNATLQHFSMPPLYSNSNSNAASQPVQEAAMNDIVKVLVELESKSNLNWRLQAGLASTFSGFHRHFSSDQINENFIPRAFRFLTSSVAAVRPVAAEGLASMLRHHKKDKQRAEAYIKLVRDFARGRSYAHRMAFVDFARNSIRLYSSRFVKDWVFDLCLELLYDPVPNVRLMVVPLLCQLKQAIKLPEDVDQLERLNTSISHSMNDNDKDVSAMARTVNVTFKKTPVRMGGGAGMMDMNGLVGGMSNYESSDKQKEEEERNDGVFATEDAKEVKAEILQIAYKKRGEAGAPGVAGAKPKPGARTSHTSTSGSSAPIKQIAVTSIASSTGISRTLGSAPLPKLPPLASSSRPAPGGPAARAVGAASSPSKPSLTSISSALRQSAGVGSAVASAGRGGAAPPASSGGLRLSAGTPSAASPTPAARPNGVSSSTNSSTASASRPSAVGASASARGAPVGAASSAAAGRSSVTGGGPTAAGAARQAGSVGGGLQSRSSGPTGSSVAAKASPTKAAVAPAVGRSPIAPVRKPLK